MMDVAEIARIRAEANAIQAHADLLEAEGMEQETPVMRAFREWQRLGAEWTAASDATESGLSDDESNRWCGIVYGAADAVLDQPSTGPMDFIYKLIAQTFDGEHEIGNCPRGAELWAEARALIGGEA